MNDILNDPVMEMGYEQFDLSLKPIENIKCDRDLILGPILLKLLLDMNLGVEIFLYYGKKFLLNYIHLLILIN